MSEPGPRRLGLNLNIRTACQRDAELLAPRLRREDRAEIAAASATPPLLALTRGLEWSASPQTIEDETGPIAMFGIVGSHRNGSPWLLGSERIRLHRREWVERSRQVFADLRAPYDYLSNWIDERNGLHIRWIRWLGFSIVGRDPVYGAQRRPFLFFEWHSPNV